MKNSLVNNQAFDKIMNEKRKCYFDSAPVRFTTLLFLTGFLFLGAGGPVAKQDLAQAGAKPKQKPNIILILSDDQRYNTIGAMGGNDVFTPYLDSLVEAGTTFTHAYNMGGWHGAICVASRTMLLTGLSLWDAQRSEKKLDELAAASGLWAQHLRTAGYETYMTGKWHVKADVHAVFNHVVHERPGMPNQVPEGYDRPHSPTDTTWKPWDEKFEGFWKGGKHWSEALADDATAFLKQAGQNDKPFFMYLAFNAPHDPRQAPKKFIDKYPLDKINLPENYLAQYPFKEEMGSGIDLRDEQLAPFPRTAYATKKQIQEYYASISHMDEQIGIILLALEASGKSENTYVFFASDHGLAVGHHGLMGKQNMFDHSVRVPLVVTGKNIPKGQKRHQQVYLQDIMPTTLELAGIQKPGQVYFNSLLPLIDKKSTPAFYPEIYGGYMNVQRMVRTEQYKMIVYPEAERVLLFDLKRDAAEIRDVSAEPAYQQALAEMKERLIRQQKQLGDTLDLTYVFNQQGVAVKPRTKAGWEILFDGKDLERWRSASKDSLPASGWIINNGELSVLRGRAGGDIITRDTYSSFELILDFKLTESANSGIKYLVNKVQNSQSKKAAYMGIEYQIIDDFNYPAVREDPESYISTGSVYLLYPPKDKKLLPPGEWNQVKIIVRGKHAEHWLNGKKIAAYERHSDEFRERLAKTKFKDYPDYALADSGRILIQDHGDEVTYRNILIRRLD